MTNVAIASIFAFALAAGGSVTAGITTGAFENRTASAHEILVSNGAEQALNKMAGDPTLGQHIVVVADAAAGAPVDQEKLAAASGAAINAAGEEGMFRWTQFVTAVMPGADAAKVDSATRDALRGEEPGLAAARAQVAALER